MHMTCDAYPCHYYVDVQEILSVPLRPLPTKRSPKLRLEYRSQPYPVLDTMLLLRGSLVPPCADTAFIHQMDGRNQPLRFVRLYVLALMSFWEPGFALYILRKIFGGTQFLQHLVRHTH
jgi:hypothetical protein